MCFIPVFFLSVVLQNMHTSMPLYGAGGQHMGASKQCDNSHWCRRFSLLSSSHNTVTPPLVIHAKGTDRRATLP